MCACARPCAAQRYYGYQVCRLCGKLITGANAKLVEAKAREKRRKDEFLKDRTKALGGLHSAALDEIDREKKRASDRAYKARKRAKANE